MITGVSVGDIVTFKGGGPNFLVAGFQAPEPAAPIDPMTPGAAFVGPQPGPRELVFSKKRYNGFAGTGLDAALRGQGIDTLVVAGLTTECCIDSSVRAAFERDYHVFVVSDATACYEPGLHQAALKALKLNCASVITAAEAAAAWI